MDKDKIIKTILDCNNYLKTITNSRFVFGGSYGLFLNGIILNREFKDIDVKFLDLSVDERRKLQIEFEPHVDKCANIPIELEYKEIIVEGTPLLVFTPQSIINAKKYQLDYINKETTIKTEQRLGHKEKVLADLKYIKDTYNLE